MFPIGINWHCAHNWQYPALSGVGGGYFELSMNLIIFGASTLKIYLSQPFFSLSCHVTMYYLGLKAASDKIVLQKKSLQRVSWHDG